MPTRGLDLEHDGLICKFGHIILGYEMPKINMLTGDNLLGDNLIMRRVIEMYSIPNIFHLHFVYF